MAQQLERPPKDLISRVQFAPSGSNNLLVSSWDSQLRVYEPKSGNLLTSVSMPAPLLDSTWDYLSPAVAYTSGMDCRIHKVDFETGTKATVGSAHEKPISCLSYHRGTGTVLAGSWDKTVQQVDPRTEQRLMTAVSGKVFAMDCVDNYLVVGMSGRQVHIYDVRNVQEPIQKRESSLKYPTRTLKCMPDGQGYASTSIEGRVAVEFFDPSEHAQAQKFAFKCHRIVDKMSGIDTVTPVNAIAFNPQHKTFFTAGSDNLVCLWDYQARKRLKQYQPLAHSALSLDVSPDGSLLAVGTSDDSYKEDPVARGSQLAESAVYLRQLSPQEVRCK